MFTRKFLTLPFVLHFQLVTAFHISLFEWSRINSCHIQCFTSVAVFGGINHGLISEDRALVICLCFPLWVIMVYRHDCYCIFLNITVTCIYMLASAYADMATWPTVSGGRNFSWTLYEKPASWYGMRFPFSTPTAGLRHSLICGGTLFKCCLCLCWSQNALFSWKPQTFRFKSLLFTAVNNYVAV